jgi:hypothetical protein
MAADRAFSYKGAAYVIATGKTAGPFFVLGVRKSGSSILNSIVQAMAEMNGYRYVDVAGKLFEAGVAVAEWQADTELAGILEPGNVYGGFRDAPRAFHGSPLYRRGRKVLMVRDPRDALVSEYFSNAYSHSLPKTGESRDGMLQLRQAALQATIDEYVLSMAQPFKRTLRQYMGLVDDPSCRILRYEDVILRKAVLIASICDVFGWTLTPRQTAAILGWADVLPAEERPTEFVRRVRPGDHREKLSPAVIEQLNGCFDEELHHFGYTA